MNGSIREKKTLTSFIAQKDVTFIADVKYIKDDEGAEANIKAAQDRGWWLIEKSYISWKDPHFRTNPNGEYYILVYYDEVIKV